MILFFMGAPMGSVLTNVQGASQRLSRTVTLDGIL